MIELLRSVSSRLAARAVALGLIPILLLIGAAYNMRPETREERTGQPQAYPVEQNFRTVVLILDSVPTPVAFDPAFMPFVSSLQSSSLFGHQQACIGKATFPCMKSIFEGRAATTGTALQDFSAVASKRTTWPGSLAEMGLRVAAVSDHTLNRLYPGAFVERLDYQTLTAPILERDKFGYEKTWKWLDDPSMNVLIIHVIGTDKVSHEFPVGGDVYRAKYLEADDFVRKVSGRLRPNDYLFVLSDHGHGEGGGHTLDAVYFARGPLFPIGQREDMAAEDMLFLLSVPYGFLLPHGYEGQIRTDLTRLPPELRAQFLRKQAELWKVPATDQPVETVEVRLNEHAAAQRNTSRQTETLRNVAVAAPWWLAAAFFLLGELWLVFSNPRRHRVFEKVELSLAIVGLVLLLVGVAFAPWLFVFAAWVRCVEKLGVLRTLIAVVLLAGAIASAFWFLPANLYWIEPKAHRNLGYAAFYFVAFLVGGALSFFTGADSWRRHLERTLWITGVSIWLLTYSGLYDYSLTRQGPRVVLGILALVAVVVRGGWRTLLTGYTICVLGLLPFIFSRTESFNIDYPLLEFFRLSHELQFVCALLLGVALVLLVRRALGARLGLNSILVTVAVMGGWLFISRWFFEISLVKMIGCCFAAIALAGLLQLFRLAQLPARWAALAGALTLFMSLTLLFSGLQLSHVDFRFAADKIFPFREESWRAPQLVVWSLIKYAFALLPALWTLRRLSPDGETPRQMLQLAWWRGLMLALGAFGLALYDPRGLHELCSEEVYFWIYLSLIAWAACRAWPRTTKTPANEGQGDPAEWPAMPARA